MDCLRQKENVFPLDLTFSMYDLNHMGGGSSSGLFPLLSFTVTCIEIHATCIKAMYPSLIIIISFPYVLECYVT